MEFYLSTKGKDKLGYQGYRYTLDRKRGDREYWICENQACKGWVVMDKRQIYSDTDHIQGPDIAATAIQQSVSRITMSASQSYDPPSSIINRELSQDLPQEMRGHFLVESSVKCTVQRNRNKKLPSLPKSLHDVKLDGKWEQTADGQNWILCDKRLIDGNRIIIFCTNRSFVHLCNANIWFADGTFWCSTSTFYQLFQSMQQLVNSCFHFVLLCYLENLIMFTLKCLLPLKKVWKSGDLK